MRLIIFSLHAFRTASTSPAWGRPTEYAAVKGLAIKYYDKYGFVDMPIAELDFIDSALKFARTVSVQLETQFIEAIGGAVGELEYMLSRDIGIHIEDHYSPMLVKLISASRLLVYASTETHKDIIESYIYEGYQIISHKNNWDRIFVGTPQKYVFQAFVLMCCTQHGLSYIDPSAQEECFKHGHLQMEGLYTFSARNMFGWRNEHYNNVPIAIGVLDLLAAVKNVCRTSCPDDPVVHCYNSYLQYSINVILHPVVGTSHERGIELGEQIGIIDDALNTYKIVRIRKALT